MPKSSIIHAVCLLFVLFSLVLVSHGVVMDRGTIVVDAPKEEKLVNSPYPGKGYCFAVNLSNSHHRPQAPRYYCRVYPPFLGFAVPWNDHGERYCVFFPFPPEHLERLLPKSENIKNEREFTVRASLGGSDHQISGSATAVFAGGFSILDMDKNSRQLNLTQDYFIHNLTIVGNTDVEVEWQNRRLTVTLLERNDFGFGGRAVYELKVPSAPNSGVFDDDRPDDFSDIVIFSRPATGQREGFNIQFTVHYPPEYYVKQYLVVLSIILACMLFVIAGVLSHPHGTLRDQVLAWGRRQD